MQLTARCTEPAKGKHVFLSGGQRARPGWTVSAFDNGQQEGPACSSTRAWGLSVTSPVFRCAGAATRGREGDVAALRSRVLPALPFSRPSEVRVRATQARMSFLPADGGHSVRLPANGVPDRTGSQKEGGKPKLCKNPLTVGVIKKSEDRF